MFDRSIDTASAYKSKRTKEEAYLQFLMSVGLSIREYPFSLNDGTSWKGVPCIFKVASWGGYANADNEWVVFIAYRCNNPKRTTQHCWAWDGENNTVINHRIMEFIN